MSKIEIEFRAAKSARRARTLVRHATKTERIRIGTNYNGEPIATMTASPRSACGKWVELADDPVNCRECIAKLRHYVEHGDERHAVAAQLALDKIYAAEDA